MPFTQDAKETPVLFRAMRENGRLWVTAIFPAEPHDTRGNYVTCYQHIGQHGACDRSFSARGRPATPEEYAPLKAELESAPYGYRLHVYKRTTRNHLAAFNAQVRAWRDLGTTQ